jgi:riboflavin synthase
MFTGIVAGIGTIETVEGKGRITVAIPKKFRTPALGASVACDGVCLTVAKKSRKRFRIEASAETQKRTTLGKWKKGRQINLESALKAGDELGGHFVTGHIDGVATLEKITRKDGHSVWKIASPKALMPFIAEKGSVSLDGVSLTVNAVKDNTFLVNIIPHTLGHTTFSSKKEKDLLNIEIDILARYVQRQRNA